MIGVPSFGSTTSCLHTVYPFHAAQLLEDGPFKLEIFQVCCTGEEGLPTEYM
jgi:hypothetical protein